MKTGCSVIKCYPKNRTEMTGFKFEGKSDGSIPLEQVPQVGIRQQCGITILCNCLKANSISKMLQINLIA